MTKKEKELLLKDLCARLPYHVKIHTWYGEVVTSDLNTFPFSMEEMDEEDMTSQLSGIKPYLRPMSSMTEEERNELSKILNYEFYIDDDFSLVAEDDRHRIRLELCEGYIDWLNAHHFDYRGLIEKNLALEAPKDMYKFD